MISIIVPTYNNENTIRSTLDSILCEKGEGIEIIIVLDGSTDGSGEICKEYQKNYSNIKLYYNESNMGVSAARNKGLRYANNEYVWFVDADDQIEKGSIGLLLYELKREPVDMLLFNYQSKIGEEVAHYSKYKLSNESMSLMNYVDLTNYIYGINNVSWAVWTKIIKRKIIFDKNIFFDETLRTSEDVDWSLKCMQHIKNVKYFDRLVYNYSIHRYSLSHSNISFINYKCGYVVYVKWFYLFRNIIMADDIKHRIAVSYCNISRMIPYLSVQDRKRALKMYKENIEIVKYCNEHKKNTKFNND